MIKEISNGNIFDSQAEALVNPVNLDGIMGKGLALEFKRKYPKMFESYRFRCKSGHLEVGDMDVWINRSGYPRYIINFPTKVHYYDKSHYVNIDLGLINLASVVVPTYDIKSIAIPALGCGLGELNWHTVKKMIIDAFNNMAFDNNVDVELYGPIKE